MKEGDKCPNCEKGTLKFEVSEDCIRHVLVPSTYDVLKELQCTKCGWKEE